MSDQLEIPNFYTAADLDRVNWPFVVEIRPGLQIPKSPKVYTAVLVTHAGEEVLQGKPRTGKAGIIKTLSRWFPGVKIKDVEKMSKFAE